MVLCHQDLAQVCCQTPLSRPTSRCCSRLRATVLSHATGPLWRLPSSPSAGAWKLSTCPAPAPSVSLPEQGSGPRVPWSKCQAGGEAMAGSMTGTGEKSGKHPWLPIPSSSAIEGAGMEGGEGGGDGVGRRASQTAKLLVGCLGVGARPPAASR